MALIVEWQRYAACYNTWPKVDMLTMQMSYQAVPLIEKYCDNCEVVAECAAFGLEDPDVMGIWGGVFVPASKGRRVALVALRRATLRDDAA